MKIKDIAPGSLCYLKTSKSGKHFIGFRCNHKESGEPIFIGIRETHENPDFSFLDNFLITCSPEDLNFDVPEKGIRTPDDTGSSIIRDCFLSGGIEIDLKSGTYNGRVIHTSDVNYVPLDKVFGLVLRRCEVIDGVIVGNYVWKPDIYVRYGYGSKLGRVYQCLGSSYNFLRPWSIEALEEYTQDNKITNINWCEESDLPFLHGIEIKERV